MQVPFLDQLDPAALPRRVLADKELIIKAGDPTDTGWIIETGKARETGRKQPYEAAMLLCVADFLAATHYSRNVRAGGACRVLAISREQAKALSVEQGRLVWPLCVSLASEICQRRDQTNAGEQK